MKTEEWIYRAAVKVALNVLKALGCENDPTRADILAKAIAEDIREEFNKSDE